MLYNYNGETFKIKFSEMDSSFKVYHKAQNRWSQGWTYVGNSKSEDKAKNIAKVYSS